MFEMLKNGLRLLVGVYLVVTTVAVFKLQPKTVLIAITPSETRVLDQSDEVTIRNEKRNFVLDFTRRLYNYTSDSYDSQISKAGDFMSKECWENTFKEYQTISEKLKTHDISQKITDIDVKLIDNDHLKADMQLVIRNKLKETHVKLKVDIFLKQYGRSVSNPYPYEVEKFSETIF
jgi:hypothetical protein